MIESLRFYMPLVAVLLVCRRCLAFCRRYFVISLQHNRGFLLICLEKLIYKTEKVIYILEIFAEMFNFA